MNPFRTGKLVMFQVTYDREWHFFEYFFAIIIGIFGVSNLCHVCYKLVVRTHDGAEIQGLYGAFVIKYNMKVVEYRKKYLKNYGSRRVGADNCYHSLSKCISAY
jgi:chloride channel 3/4/5